MKNTHKRIIKSLIAALAFAATPSFAISYSVMPFEEYLADRKQCTPIDPGNISSMQFMNDLRRFESGRYDPYNPPKTSVFIAKFKNGDMFQYYIRFPKVRRFNMKKLEELIIDPRVKSSLHTYGFVCQGTEINTGSKNTEPQKQANVYTSKADDMRELKKQIFDLLKNVHANSKLQQDFALSLHPLRNNANQPLLIQVGNTIFAGMAINQQGSTSWNSIALVNERDLSHALEQFGPSIASKTNTDYIKFWQNEASASLDQMRKAAHHSLNVSATIKIDSMATAETAGLVLAEKADLTVKEDAIAQPQQPAREYDTRAWASNVQAQMIEAQLNSLDTGSDPFMATMSMISIFSQLQSAEPEAFKVYISKAIDKLKAKGLEKYASVLETYAKSHPDPAGHREALMTLTKLRP